MPDTYAGFNPCRASVTTHSTIWGIQKLYKANTSSVVYLHTQASEVSFREKGRGQPKLCVSPGMHLYDAWLNLRATKTVRSPMEPRSHEYAAQQRAIKSSIQS